MIFIVFGLALIAAALIYLIIASAGNQRCAWNDFVEQYSIEIPAPQKKRKISSFFCHRRTNANGLSVAEYDRLFAAWESELDPEIRAISGLFVDGAR